MGDPFRVLDIDIFPLILQHFDTNDLKKVALVSRSWNDLIGTSRQCMKRVICRIERPQLQLKMLEESVRQYENFKISPHGHYQELSEILTHFYVRNVWINETCVKEVDHSEYVNLMRSFSDTVEYLQTGDIATKNANRVITIDFPKLKKLHCSFSNRSAFSIFNGVNKQLETVILSSELNSRDEEFSTHENIITEFLTKNQQITNLWLLHLEKLFVYDISQKVTQKLRHITFTTNFQNLPQHVRENFIRFIKAQRCLEAINIMGCREKSILTSIWNNGVKFRKLFVIDCNYYDELSPYDLEKNMNIEEIDFYLSSSVHAYFLLSAAPNIVAYKIRQLSKQLLEFSLQLKKLKEIKFQSIDAEALKYYKNLCYKSHDKKLPKLKELDFFDYLNIDKRLNG
ncbi:hypothetical protein PVAND_006972 [Polypedilum vanderplanki]|uniref:F-box domain-containing protein n=1 Tax=Polypedilum vanderplanki TaxID=319348 RepID=A0A9J6C5T4_POLVA|nr:hypothetical protein PVAND_006972 [Polypedilum vanderplanki]